MRKLLLLLLIPAVLLAFYPGKPLQSKVLIIYQKAGKVRSTVVPLSEASATISSIQASGGVIVKKIHLWRIQWVPPKIKPNAFYNVGGELWGPAWQVDTGHLNLPLVWQLIARKNIPINVKVAVIDTGVKDLSTLNVDTTEGVALTGLVDILNQSGYCNLTGYVTFPSNLTFVNGLLLEYGDVENMTLGNITFKFCLYNETLDWFNDGKNDTVIFLQATNPNADVVGHGTFVTSQINGLVKELALVTGVEPSIQVIPIKADTLAIVMNNINQMNITSTNTASDLIRFLENNVTWDQRILSGSFFADPDLILASQYVAALAQNDKNLKVVNMSLGGWGTQTDVSTLCSYTVEVMAGAGLHVVVAAGNDGVNIDTMHNYGYYNYPADCPSAIPVSALNNAYNLASFSNYGSVIKFTAPGERNTGIYPYPSMIGDVYAYYGVQLYINPTEGYLIAMSSGTSYASPLVAGSVALAIALGAQDPVNALANSATDLFTPGVDIYSGYGEPNLANLAESLGYQLLETTTMTTNTMTVTFMVEPKTVTVTGRPGAEVTTYVSVSVMPSTTATVALGNYTTTIVGNGTLPLTVSVVNEGTSTYTLEATVGTVSASTVIQAIVKVQTALPWLPALAVAVVITLLRRRK